MPKDKVGCRKFALGAEEKWQFPNASAAADGNKISLYCHGNTTSKFYNYKGLYRSVFLAPVPAGMRCIWEISGTS